VSLLTAIIILVVLAVALIGALAFVMTRPSNLRPHRPSWRRVARFRRAHGRAPRDGSTS
jgi:hypothetical protein